MRRMSKQERWIQSLSCIWQHTHTHTRKSFSQVFMHPPPPRLLYLRTVIPTILNRLILVGVIFARVDVCHSLTCTHSYRCCLATSLVAVTAAAAMVSVDSGAVVFVVAAACGSGDDGSSSAMSARRPVALSTGAT